MVETLPSDTCLPRAIVGLGLLSELIRPRENDICIQVDASEAQEITAIVLPETLVEIRKLCRDLTRSNHQYDQEAVGKFLQRTGLTRHPTAGNDLCDFQAIEPINKITDAPELDVTGWKPSDQSRPADKSTQSESKQQSDIKTLLAGNKRVTYWGGERITGKSGLSDPERIKDAGLHRGGG
ncbi:hypothetical protein [Halobaculum magnesiiphilum]|uniref:Uncharacterized protein n=1 Tax=Halobaculum magnesiiphilum TaxID=1017351 RepID=A0A8T8W953_9EURY|nr:hypothetical protein [Halobaculum magnesiiphilum]QZP36379.1 hypothetical protein K6T50_08515 [Halobaculum magnesiiphilum]